MCAQLTADLHLHTTASDGTLTVDELPAAAKDAGLEWIAVTDHDRIHPELTAPVTIYDGINIIRGIELRVQDGAHRFDLLGYGVEPTTELTAELDRLQADRIARAKEIIDCVESQLGVDLDLEPQPGVGRPHIARAIDDSDAPYDFSQAFSDLIGNDCPCYVPREITTVDNGVALLQDACRIVGLAHPLRYSDPEAALELTAELDAVERFYPYGRTVDTTPVDRAIERHDLLVTGGSDAHDTTLGKAGLSKSQGEEFRTRFEAQSDTSRDSTKK
jgi:hypothetical protein